MTNIAIGETSRVEGEVTVIHADGSSERLVQGASIFPDDTVITADNGSVRIAFLDGRSFDLGAGTTTVLDASLYDPSGAGFAQQDTGLFGGDYVTSSVSGKKSDFDGPDDVFSGESDAVALREAVLAGKDPSDIADAPAAGEGVEGVEDNDGSSIVILEATRDRVTPDSGHNTHGFELSFTTPDEESSQPPEEPVSISFIPETINGDIVTEGQSLLCRVELSRPNMTDDVSATWTLTFGSASLPDLSTNVVLSGTVTIPAGRTSATIEIPTFDDYLFEGGNDSFEDLTLILSDITNAEPGQVVATGLIEDNEQFTVSIGDGVPGPVPEGTDGTVSFEVTLSNAADQAVTVDYTTVNGTAIAGQDYIAASGTLSFAAGETSKTVTITVLNDEAFEDIEAFSVDITNAVYAPGTDAATALAIADSSGIASIVDDDMTSVYVSDGIPNPAVEGTDGSITFTVTLTNPSTIPVTVDYTTTNGTAIAGEDYIAASDTLTFAAGETTKTVTITVLNDAIFEDPEAFSVDISNADAGGTALTIIDSSGAGSIIDDDQLTVAITDGSPNPQTEADAATITFEVTLSNAADQAVTVDYTTVNGTAIAGEDYIAASDTLTFAAGETTKTVTITVLNDAIFEDPEAFSVDISNADAGGTALAITDSSGAGNIIDDDQLTVAITDGSPNPQTEADAATITFEVTLSNAADQAVTVDYTTINGSAIAGEDYIAASDTLTFAAGETTKTVTITVLNDAIFEDPEAFSVDISNADAGGTALTITDSSGAGSISDDDQLMVAIADGNPGPQTEADAATITFEVTLSNAADKAVTVDYTTVNGTAIAGEDYIAASDTLTFAAGETTKTVTITVLNDAIFEDPEAFSVDISNADAGGTALMITDSSGAGSIIDDDQLTVAIADGNPGPQTEADAATITFDITLTNAADQAVTVDYTTVNGTAIAGQDYIAASDTLTFAAGETTKTVTITVLNDAIFEDPEAFSVDISNADAGGTALTITDSSGAGSIVDDDNIPVANNDTNWVQEDGASAINGNVLQTISHPGSPGGSFSDLADTDADGDALIITSITNGTDTVAPDADGELITGKYGSLFISNTGSYVYTLDDTSAVVDALGEGDTLTDEMFTYAVTDGANISQTAVLSITIFGTNDAPVANPDTHYIDEGINGDAGNITGIVLQDADHGMDSSASANGAESYADAQDTDSEGGTLGVISVSSNATADASSDLVADSTVQGQYGVLTMNTDGTYTYDLDDGNPVVDALKVGDELEDVFTYTIQDDGGLTRSTTLNVTINGQNDRAIFNAGTFVWLPVALDEMAPEYQDGYPIDLPVSDVDSALTIEITEVPDEGVAGYYNGDTFIPVGVGDTFDLAIGESMPEIIYLPPAIDLDPQDDPVVDVISFTVTEDGDLATTTSGTITINAMPPYKLPGLEARIGDGSEPLTSGRALEADLVLDAALVKAINTDLADDGVINSSFIELFTDFQSKPASGGVPIPDANRADQALEDTVTATLMVDGIEFVVINENDGVNQWTYDADTGLMKAVIDYNDVMDLATGTISLADHLENNQASSGDVWTVSYTDSDGGNEQARVMKFNFTYDNPGDPSVSVSGDEFSPNIIYGASGTDILTGGNVDDNMFGREGDDEINGLDGNDILVGGGGDDIIVGGGGNDEMHGGEGADAFVISSLSDGVDTIVTYDDSESDVLDISDILTGYDSNTDDITNFVNITADGADAIVSVDPTGTGMYTDIAVLSNMSGNTVTVIVDQENNSETLIVA